ncbi:SURF1 family protein [Puniceibacterium sediminis]|uniref:SURF1-like protein n=1 Tax=Puniceibacterium sediminis TaxID=1608407 RepID=A0A238X015_9RHOB|nr:SURF1 family protein [Puniceibacterium sediminis]SNR51199.1 surfeit locus 1 family protein [Puniceibacterium sediminis]
MKRIIAPLLFGLIGAAILVGLGRWQLQRLEWKQGILTQIESRIGGEPLPLPTSVDPEANKYQPVDLPGEIIPDELHVLVSVKQVGAGYRVISPFVTGGRRVLLDRGFIPVEDVALDRPGGTAEVQGNLHWPDDRNSSTPENDMVGNIWFARDITQMAEVLKTEPLLIIASDVTPADPGVTPLPLNASGIPNDHLQYAITWFALALVWLIMTTGYIWRQQNPKRDER